MGESESRVKVDKDKDKTLEMKSDDAVVLYPSLGNPAIVGVNNHSTGKKDRLELLLLCKVSTLSADQAAMHLKISPWKKKDNSASVDDQTIWKLFAKEDKKSVCLSRSYKVTKDLFGSGPQSPDIHEEKNNGITFRLKLSYFNVFPWVIEALESYPYLYKVSIDISRLPCGLYHIWWVNKQDYFTVREKRKWYDLIQHFKNLNAGAFKKPEPYKKELKEYDPGVWEDLTDKNKNENICAGIYHPVFIMNKPELNIGHLTDIHLDSRMEVYGQSDASVIEVKENCPVQPDKHGLEREITNRKYHEPIKKKIANFNNIFSELCLKLKKEKADVIVITGDLVDYNRGIHTQQTYRKCFVPISEVWDALGANVTKEEHYRTDRNWFLFYDKLLEFYDQDNPIPIITMLGNHDYVNFGMAPWPYAGLPWNGVFDQNLTLYESALCFGEGYKSGKAFRKDAVEKAEFVEWYTLFINPFADFVVEYGDQSMFMVDWGVKSNIASSVTAGSGGLHHARHLFKEPEDFVKKKSSGRDGQNTTELEFRAPFPIKNYTIYKTWLKTAPSVKMLFMHATAICPKDNVSEGEINLELEWPDSKLCYGSFDSRRDEILGDVEKGDLNIIVSGHSHRNVVMRVDGKPEKKAIVLGAGEDFSIVDTEPKHIVMVTSSGGPLPKYIPGGPLICACAEHFHAGWFYQKGGLFRKERLFEYQNGEKREVKHFVHMLGREPGNYYERKKEMKVLSCPDCKMPAKDMVRKHARRHRPGGNLLAFDDGRVKIKSVFSELKSSFPRPGVMCDEHKVFTGLMKFEYIKNENDFKKWEKDEPISIICRSKFIKHGYMEFPMHVEYITFSTMVHGAEGNVNEIDLGNCKVQIRQTIPKDKLLDFRRAAKNDADFAFVRYRFSSIKAGEWDREVKMYKDIEGKMNAVESSTIGQRKDSFKGLVIKFLRKPDLKKRKKLCGY